MSRFDFIPTSFQGLFVAQRLALEDSRGFLSRIFCADAFHAYGFNESVAQVNQVLTFKKGVVRGFHFQRPPFSEIKLVSCTKGEVVDVVIDLRKNSPTFLKSYSIKLAEDNFKSLLIPKGFAHGYQTLSEGCELLYLHSKAYAAEFEGGVNIQDPMIIVDWPLPISEISDRDLSHPFLESNFEGFLV